jgi:hypothetical protein
MPMDGAVTLFRGKKGHFMTEFVRVLPVWRAKSGLCHKKLKNTSLPTGKP